MRKILSKNRNFIYIFIITLISIIIDLSIINYQHNLTPAWDQGYHLSNAYKYTLLFKEINIFSEEWINSFWSVTDSYRGPLTYIFSGIFMNIFGMSYKNAILSNQIFNLITIISIYQLGKKIYSSNLGIISATIFTLSPVVINLRTDFLIDISLCAVITLNWFYLTKIYFKENCNYFDAFISGCLLGLVFLVKPTGFVYFVFPLIILLFKIFKNDSNLSKKIIIIFLYIFSFTAIISPWVSLNWITIISSINTAWNWGINYQEGLDANTISGWTFYLKEIFKIPGFYFSSLIISFGLLNLKKIIHLDKNKKSFLFDKRFIWYLSFPLSIYLIGSLMSTKDIRFILPIYPQLCIIFGLIIMRIALKKNIKKFIVIFLFSILLVNSFSFNLKEKQKKSSYSDNDDIKYNFNKLHQEIVKSISLVSPYNKKIVGMIPDLGLLNTFNLEAEAIRQNNNVSIRQIISNEENYKKDLYNFDWFILKTGNQGIMQSESRNKLEQLIRESDSFYVFKNWELPNGDDISLMKRKLISNDIKYKYCENKIPSIKVEIMKNGIKSEIIGKIKDLKNSIVLINLFENNKKNNGYFYEENFVIPELNYEDQEIYNCAKIDIISHESNLKNRFKNIPYFKATLVNEEQKIYPSEKVLISDNNKNIKYIKNKIKSVKYLGLLLKNGEFEKLFNLVSLLNQSDPTQKYLKDSELIYSYKYSNTNDINNLYPLAISQILQKKADKASKTIDRIILYENKNPNLFLAKSITELYQFKFSESEIAVKKAIEINKENKLKDTLNTILLINKLFQLKFISFYN